MTHEQVEGVPVGKNPLVSLLLKGIYNSRPLQPRYLTTWDVDIVVRYLQSLGDNASLSLKVLSQKLEASRILEIQASDIVFQPEGVLFTLPTLGKKRTVGAPPSR